MGRARAVPSGDRFGAWWFVETGAIAIPPPLRLCGFARDLQLRATRSEKRPEPTT